MVDPDMNNEENAPINEVESDDTKTRKTVRLKPSATPAGINLNPLPKTPLTDPMSGRDTDTGNLEVMEDTQTRRTVKLRPISTQAGAATVKPLPTPGAAPAAPAAPAADGANTQTRKTIVLKPTAVAPAVKLDGPTGAVPESDDTKTRKTVRLKPSAVMPPQMTGAAAAEPAESDIESSDTIKIARPPRPGSMIPPKPLMPAMGAIPATGQAPGTVGKPSHALPVAKPLPAQTPLPAPGGEPLTSSRAVPRIPDAPVAKPSADDDLQLKPAGSSNASKEGDPSVLTPPDAAKGSDAAASDKSPLAGMRPMQTAKAGASKLYLGLAIACTLLVAGTLTLTLVQYLNLCQMQKIELPFLSQSK